LVVTTNNYQVLAKLVDSINNIGRFEIRWFPAVNVEDLDGVLEDAMKVDREVVRLVGGRGNTKSWSNLLSSRRANSSLSFD